MKNTKDYFPPNYVGRSAETPDQRQMRFMTFVARTAMSLSDEYTDIYYSFLERLVVWGKLTTHHANMIASNAFKNKPILDDFLKITDQYEFRYNATRYFEYLFEEGVTQYRPPVPSAELEGKQHYADNRRNSRFMDRHGDTPKKRFASLIKPAL